VQIPAPPNLKEAIMEYQIIFWTLFLFVLYLLPWLEAWRRGHSKTSAIGVLNILFGWTFIGWGIALVWAFTEQNNN
jgi:threonine/homoserine/homoserine lactone efflux protein